MHSNRIAIAMFTFALFGMSAPALAADLTATSSPAAASTASPAASTALGPGTAAPALSLQSVVGGKTETYDLQKAAASRPVVLYFFVKAFTSG